MTEKPFASLPLVILLQNAILICEMTFPKNSDFAKAVWGLSRQTQGNTKDISQKI